MDIEELRSHICVVFVVAVDLIKGLDVDDSGFVYDNGDTIFKTPMTIEAIQNYKDSGLLDTHMVRNNFGAYVSKKALEINPELINFDKSVYSRAGYVGDEQSLKKEYIARLDEILT